jgi:hypothetical protein
MQSEDVGHNEQPVREPLHRAASSQRKPKGILKNANQVNPGPQQYVNIASNAHFLLTFQFMKNSAVGRAKHRANGNTEG